MASQTFLTHPVDSTEMPRGIPYIIGNEAAERFSFYGMRAILVIFMTRYLLDAQGESAPMEEAEATSWFHLFMAAVYLTPLMGALLADIFVGKYKTILGLSLVYCLGHLALAVDETRLGLSVGLFLIALGSGGIKPCVSAHVGDQFGHKNAHRLRDVFSYFYFAINLGAFASTLMTPLLLEHAGPHLAFGLPGALMLIATWVFWLGREKFVHVPPHGRTFLHQLFSRGGFRTLLPLALLYAFVAVFWSLFDQTGSSWVIQAEGMDRQLFGVEVLPSQIQALNPLYVMILIPLFVYFIYPAMDRFFPATPLRRISIGLFLAVPSYLLMAQLEMWIAAGHTPSIAWHLLSYLILTAAEVLISITALEFAYTQAPTAMKSIVMALALASVSLGNLFTAAVNTFIQSEQNQSWLTGPAYFLFFGALMAFTALAFVPFAIRYREKAHLQDDDRSEALPN
ncbi:MAG: MFS transporter [Deltaproteobacteria bacterium]|nr:MFS transporter [Deltaproteobacteria bacterium]